MIVNVTLVHHVESHVCTGAYSRTSSEILFNELHWVSLKARRTLSKMTHFYRIVNGHVPSYLSCKITIVSTHVRRTRHQNNQSCRVIECFCRLKCYKRSSFPDSSRVRNSLGIMNCLVVYPHPYLGRR